MPGQSKKLIRKYRLAAIPFIIIGLVIVFYLIAALNSKPAVYTATKSSSSISTSIAASTAITSSKATGEAPVGKRYSIFLPKHPISDAPNAAGNIELGGLDRFTDRRDVKEFLIEEILVGPNFAEQDLGFYLPAPERDGQVKLTGTSNCGGKDFKITLDQGIATLKFCRTVWGVGSYADGQVLESFKQTLNKFDDVDSVVVLDYEGNCLFDQSGINACLN